MYLCLLGTFTQSMPCFFINCLSSSVAFTVQQVLGFNMITLTAVTVSSMSPTQSCNHVSTKWVNSVLSSSPGNHQLFLIATLCYTNLRTLLQSSSGRYNTSHPGNVFSYTSSMSLTDMIAPSATV